MNWKEQFDIKHANTHWTNSQDWIKDFISTEIIEKLFEEFQQLVSDGHCSLNPELKQLRDKWR